MFRPLDGFVGVSYTSKNIQWRTIVVVRSFFMLLFYYAIWLMSRLGEVLVHFHELGDALGFGFDSTPEAVCLHDGTVVGSMGME